MPITFFTWCIFSFVLLILVASIKINSKLVTYFRWINICILLPTIGISILIVKLTLLDHAELVHSYSNKLFPIDFNIRIDAFIAMLSCAALISFGITLLIAHFVYLASFITPTIIFYFSIITASLFSNLFITLSLISIAEIIIIFLILLNNSKNFTSASHKHYFWMITANFSSITGLYLAPSFPMMAYSLFVIPCLIKLFLLPSLKKDMIKNYSSSTWGQFLYINYIVMSSSLFLMKALISLPTQMSLILTFIASIAVIYSLFLTVTNFKKHKEIYITITLFSIIILSFVMHYNIISEAIICALFLVFPLHLYSVAPKNIITKIAENNLEIDRFDIGHNITILFIKILDFLAHITAAIIGPLYGSVLLLKIPQILIGLVQIPLRIFHNGSIRRSVLFIVIMVISYYYIWEPQ